MLPDWLRDTFISLQRSLESGSHALLLTGMTGIGKRALADHLARSRLCDTPSEQGACGVCTSCQWLAARTHPDLILLEPTQEELESDAEEVASPAKKGKVRQYIVIEQIRDLLSQLELTSHAGKGRVIIVDPAERLNSNAANALLKTLEEPPPRTVFMLISAHEERLPITLRSRCRRVPFVRPSRAVALGWLHAMGIEKADGLLRLAGGAPARVPQIKEGGMAERWGRLVESLTPQAKRSIEWDTTPNGLAELCLLLQMLCIDLHRIRIGATAMYSEPNDAVIEKAARQLAPDAISEFWRALGKIRAVVQHPLNGALLRDQLLLAFDQMLTSPAQAQ